MPEINENTVLIYMTTVTSTVAILKKQRAILDLLEAKKIPHAQIDMCSDTSARPRMLKLIPDNRKRPGQPILPPQVFIGDEYCGDFDDWEYSKEIGLVYSFFKKWPAEGSEEEKILCQYKNAGQIPPFCPRDF